MLLRLLMVLPWRETGDGRCCEVCEFVTSGFVIMRLDNEGGCDVGAVDASALEVESRVDEDLVVGMDSLEPLGFLEGASWRKLALDRRRRSFKNEGIAAVRQQHAFLAVSGQLG